MSRIRQSILVGLWPMVLAVPATAQEGAGVQFFVRSFDQAALVDSAPTASLTYEDIDGVNVMTVREGRLTATFRASEAVLNCGEAGMGVSPDDSDESPEVLGDDYVLIQFNLDVYFEYIQIAPFLGEGDCVGFTLGTGGGDSSLDEDCTPEGSVRRPSQRRLIPAEGGYVLLRNLSEEGFAIERVQVTLADAVEAGLHLAITGPATSLMINTEGTFAYTVSNNGPDDATGVAATLALPSNVEIVDVTPEPGTTYDESHQTWQIGTVPQNETRTLLVRVRVPPQSGESFTMSGMVTGDQIDALPSDNHAELTTPIIRPGDHPDNPSYSQNELVSALINAFFGNCGDDSEMAASLTLLGLFPLKACTRRRRHAGVFGPDGKEASQ